jgi:LmbE family N-acetylglucosaminyl deacetylase
MRDMRPLLILLALGACGDNLPPAGDPLVRGGDVVIVAHQDDDLFFMQPDLIEAVQSGGGITSIYVTAGNDAHGPEAADPRYAGLRYAYGFAAGSNDWQCGWISIAGHVAEHCRLADKPVSLVFLAYPDGGVHGEFTGSLLDLWEGTIDSAETVAYRTTRYTRDELVETVAQVLRETQPATVHTLEVAATHGNDHSDHMIVGALALLAMARANSHADVISYRAYSSSGEAPNKVPAIYDDTFGMLAHYEACTAKCAPCGTACTKVDDAHVAWLSRRYAVGFRPAVAGRLRTDTRCLSADLTLGDCETAPSWRVGHDGELRSVDDRCVDVGPSGDVSLTNCAGGSERRFFVDDEGHLWSGLPPAPTSNMDYAHLWCLAPTDIGGVAAQLCGRDSAPTWEFAPPTVSTSRAALGFAASGRDVRLGDVDGDGMADLCTVQNGVLICALGDGGGGFVTPAVEVDNPLFPLTVEPASLTFGDVDGDHRMDACGRDHDGILCATAANGFAAMRWSVSFNDGVASTDTSSSLTAVMSAICGVDVAGVVCASPGPTQPSVLSKWPAASELVWPADLDGDQHADWCAATDSGPSCGVAAESETTTDGTSWGFSQDGVVDIGSLSNSATVGVADIDGDGRADLCTPSDDRVLCARSQGRGFGPRTTLAILPGSVTVALWLGDLDGDGRADPCVDTGDAIVCAVQ